MAKIRTVEKLAVVLPDGTKSDIDSSLVSKYGLTVGKSTPFSRAPMETVTRTIEQNSGPREWTAEEDEYILSHWDTTTKEMMENHLMVTTAKLTKRYKQLIAEKTAEEKRTVKASSRKTKKKS